MIVFLSACIYLPDVDDDPEPYKTIDLANIRQEETTRTQIIELLGQPQYKLQQDSIWIYFASRSLGTWININPFALPYIGHRQYDDQAVVIEFDGTLVKSFEVVEDFNSFSMAAPGCTSNGICMLVYSREKNSAELKVYSTGNLDLKAKKFQPIPNICSLYIYSSGSLNTLVKISGAKLKPLWLSEYDYVNTHLDPGNYEIQADYKKGRDPLKISVDCMSEDVLFLDVPRRFWGVGIEMNIVDKASAKKALKHRYLVLTPYFIRDRPNGRK